MTEELKEVTFEQANAICRRLVPLGEMAIQTLDKLRDAGFSAFVKRDEFYAAFARDEEELRVYQRCLLETAKEMLGRPSLYRIPAGAVYSSPYLERLRQEGFLEYEIDPVRRRANHFHQTEKALYESRWQSMLEAQQRHLSEEAGRLTSDLSTGFAFDRNGRFSFIKKAVAWYGASCGFTYDKRRSTNQRPLFSKQLNANWDLCLIIPDTAHIAWLDQPHGHLSFALLVAYRDWSAYRSKIKAKDDQILTLRYGWAALQHFGGAYLRFESLKDVEIITAAYLELFKIVSPVIEEAITTELK